VCAELGQNWAVAGARKGKRKRPAGLDWMRAEKEERERERERERVLFFFKNFLFKFIFQTFKQNPCIRNMMHKHLLILNYFSDV
jgi:protein gp37